MTKKFSIRRVVAVAAIVAAGGTVFAFTPMGAQAAALIDGGDVKDQSLFSRDLAPESVNSSEIGNQSIKSGDIAEGGVGQSEIRNGSVHHGELSPSVWDYVQKGYEAYNRPDTTMSTEEAAAMATLQEEVAALRAEVDALKGEDESGVNKNWVANEGASIDGPNKVTLSNVGTSAGSSVEIQNLDLPVDATRKIKFTYELKDGAVYGGGSPRVFIEVGGEYINTFNADPTEAGTDNGDGTFTKEFTIGKNGRVGAAGVVVDSGVGSVVVTDLVISGHAVQFN